MLAVWLVCALALAGLLYWGLSAKRGSQPVAARARPGVQKDAAKPAASKPKTPARSEITDKTDKTDKADKNAGAAPKAPDAGAVYEDYQGIKSESELHRVDDLLEDFLEAHGIGSEQIARRFVKHTAASGVPWTHQEVEVKFKPGENLAVLREDLQERIPALGPNIHFAWEVNKPDQLLGAVKIRNRLSHKLALFQTQGKSDPQQRDKPKSALGAPGQPTAPPVPPPEELPFLGKAALVIDDFGVDLDIAKAFLALPLPLTFSVLPYQRYSQEIAELAYAQGHEVLVHMPMEPQDYPRVNPGSGALLVSMSREKIQENLNLALANIPHATGVNNHMGSSFTAQPEQMKWVLLELQKRGLYFLDSYTSPQSVGCSIAGQLRVPCGRRHIFLDHDPTENFVRAQLTRLLRQAKIQGSAVAIGHPHPATLNVLREEAARFKQDRINLVPLKELLLTGTLDRAAAAKRAAQ